MNQRLLVYQALWAMDRLVTPEASLAEKFDRVQAAGFDGMAIDLGALTMAQAEATVPHFERTGLLEGLTAFPQSVEDLRPAPVKLEDMKTRAVARTRCHRLPMRR